MNKFNELSILGLGFGLGMTWAIGMFVLGILAWCCGWGTEMVNVLASLYIGYAPTLLGSVIGAVWGFVDCFIAGVLIAWFYNWAVRVFG